MSEKSYMETLGEASSTARSAHHAAQIVAAMTPPARVDGIGEQAAAQTAHGAPKPSLGKAIVGVAPGVVGGVVGLAMWSEHRVLGFLAGHAVGSNAGAVLRGGQDRKTAVSRIAVEGSGVAGALALKNKMHPVFGWMVGIAAGFAATAMVSGTPARALYNKLKG